MSVMFKTIARGEDYTAFRTLNEEWITRFFALEPKDLEILGNPETHILDKGGVVIFGCKDREPVACVALIPMGGGVYELSKMAVSPHLRGQGVGRQLVLFAIEQARRLGANKLFLGSSTKLPNAVHLYEAVGFCHVPPEEVPPMPYVRATVFMQMTL
jgi:putative acetyltransferase